ncbi:hypothetical protein G9A89_019859 [Geosiphon pyriformis]|nr:hypothetical protein G9A89_019859 [Geosiphon pyriformis]
MSSANLTLHNLYMQRTATSERPCFVCNKFTTNVLRNEDGTDWFYTCVSHLNDKGFARPVVEAEPEPKISLPKKNINSPSNSTNKKEKSISSDKGEKEESDKNQAKGEITEKESKAKSKISLEKEKSKSGTNTLETLAKLQQPHKPKQYILQRDIFYLRESSLLKRQREQVKNVLKQLPSVPKTNFP